LINRTERGILTARLSDAIRRWSARYVPDDIRTHCELTLPDEETASVPEAHEWLLATRQSTPVMSIGLAEDWPRGLAGIVLTERQALSLDPAGRQLMRDLGVGLFEELGQGVLDAALAIRPTEGELMWSGPTASAAATEGKVLAHCRLGDTLDLLITFWPDTVHRCLAPDVPRRGAVLPLEPLSRALQAERVVLDGIAGEAELALEELTTLAVGDVIKLNHKISEPLRVCIRGGGVVCAARLGASKGRTALQLT
jgi:hypothetical protein